jgi:hypothetical protein
VCLAAIYVGGAALATAVARRETLTRTVATSVALLVAATLALPDVHRGVVAPLRAGGAGLSIGRRPDHATVHRQPPAARAVFGRTASGERLGADGRNHAELGHLPMVLHPNL